MVATRRVVTRLFSHFQSAISLDAFWSCFPLSFFFFFFVFSWIFSFPPYYRIDGTRSVPRSSYDVATNDYWMRKQDGTCAYYDEEEASYNSRISWYGRKTREKTGTFSLKVNGGSVKATLQFKTARYIECTNLTNFNGDVQTTDHIDETQTFNIKLGGELKEG